MAADKEYIERGAALRILEKSLTFSETELDKGDFRKGCIAATQDDIGNIKHMPAADVAPVVHGYWKWETKIEPQAQNRLYCSVCDNECLAKGDYYEKSKYCPHCGAKMDGERKDIP